MQAAGAARPILADLEKLAGSLRGKLQGKLVSDPEMARRFGSDIAAVVRCIDLLEKRYPDTPSSRRALSLKLRLGIGLPARPAGVEEALLGQGPAGGVPKEKAKKAEPPPEGNLISNGGFEIVSRQGGFPVDWTAGQWGRHGVKYTVRLDRTNPHAGERALVVRAFDEDAEPGVYATLDLQPWKYEVRYWACADIGRKAHVRASLADQDLGDDLVTEDWKQFRHTVVIERKHLNAKLRFRTPTPRVRVWLDDVELEAVREKEEDSPWG